MEKSKLSSETCQGQPPVGLAKVVVSFSEYVFFNTFCEIYNQITEYIICTNEVNHLWNRQPWSFSGGEVSEQCST